MGTSGNVPIRDQYGASVREPASKKRPATFPFAALHGAAMQRRGTRPGTLRLEALVVRIGKKDVARLASLSDLGAGDLGHLPQPETVQYGNVQSYGTVRVQVSLTYACFWQGHDADWILSMKLRWSPRRERGAEHHAEGQSCFSWME
jgi:hypothetical protein